MFLVCQLLAFPSFDCFWTTLILELVHCTRAKCTWYTVWQKQQFDWSIKKIGTKQLLEQPLPGVWNRWLACALQNVIDGWTAPRNWKPWPPFSDAWKARSGMATSTGWQPFISKFIWCTLHQKKFIFCSNCNWTEICANVDIDVEMININICLKANCIWITVMITTNCNIIIFYWCLSQRTSNTSWSFCIIHTSKFSAASLYTTS